MKNPVQFFVVLSPAIPRIWEIPGVPNDEKHLTAVFDLISVRRILYKPLHLGRRSRIN